MTRNQKTGRDEKKVKTKRFLLSVAVFVMHPPSVPASVRPNKNILEQKAICVEIPLVTSVSRAPCSEEEKPSISGVAVTESDDFKIMEFRVIGNKI